MPSGVIILSTAISKAVPPKTFSPTLLISSKIPSIGLSISFFLSLALFFKNLLTSFLTFFCNSFQRIYPFNTSLSFSLCPFRFYKDYKLGIQTIRQILKLKSKRKISSDSNIIQFIFGKTQVLNNYFNRKALDFVHSLAFYMRFVYLQNTSNDHSF